MTPNKVYRFIYMIEIYISSRVTFPAKLDQIVQVEQPLRCCQLTNTALLTPYSRTVRFLESLRDSDS